MSRSLYNLSNSFNSRFASGLNTANRYYDNVSRVAGPALSGAPPSSFWGRAGRVAGGFGKGFTQLGSGAATGAAIGGALTLGNPIGTAAGTVIGGLASLPRAVGSVWNAIRGVRRDNSRRAGMDTPRDLQMLDSELMRDGRYQFGRGYHPAARRMTSGAIPQDAMEVVTAFDPAPPSYGRVSRYIPNYRYLMDGYNGPNRQMYSNALGYIRKPAELYRNAVRSYT